MNPVHCLHRRGMQGKFKALAVIFKECCHIAMFAPVLLSSCPRIIKVKMDGRNSFVDSTMEGQNEALSTVYTNVG